MLNKLLPLLVLLYFNLSSLIFGQTYVSGNVSGTWTLSGSPYIVVGDITVPGGQTLTILPGVEVKFDGYYKFYISGTINAIGNANNYIYFRSNKPNPAPGDWCKILFDNATTLNYGVLKYCIIEDFGDNLDEGGIIIRYGPLEINRCIIRNFLTGILFYSSLNSIFRNNLIEPSSASVVGFYSLGVVDSRITIEYNTIICQQDDWGMLLSQAEIAWAIIKNNVIINNNNSSTLSGLWYRPYPPGSAVNPNTIIDYNNVYGFSTNYDIPLPINSNISADPLFIDNGNYNLQSLSPCIDTGDPISPLDPDGTRSDMGAFPFHHIISNILPNGGEILEAGNSYNIQYRLLEPMAVKLEYSSDNGFYWQEIGTTTLQDTGYHNYNWNVIPTINSNYCRVKISKINDPSLHIQSNSPFTIIIGNVIPAAPTNLQATSVGINSVTMSWNDNSNNEIGFRIFRRQGSGSWDLIHTTGVNETSFTDNSVSQNTNYTYKITSFNNSGNSSDSNPLNITTGGLPDTPSNLSALVISETSIKIQWNDNSNNESSFKIERSSGGGWNEIASRPSNTQSYTDYNLITGTTYYYRVRAHNNYGYSDYSNEVSALPSNLPQPPSNLTATTQSTSRIDLHWQDNSTDETGFKIYYRKSSTEWTFLIQLYSNVTQYINLNLLSGTTYYYKVQAIKGILESAFSDPASATTGSIPTSPSDLTGDIISSTQVLLHWSDRSNNETGFKIQRSVNGGSWDIDYATVGSNVTNFQDNSVTPQIEHSYRIKAFNIYGQSTPSTEASFTTAPPIFSFNVRAMFNGQGLGGADVYIISGSNKYYFGQTDPNGYKFIQDRTIGDKIFIEKKIYSKPSVRGYHNIVDNRMFDLFIDSKTLSSNGDGEFIDYPIDEVDSLFIVNLTHPTFRFNLVIAYDFPDAGNIFTNRLQSIIKEANKHLFNATDGQVCIDKYAIYKNVWSFAPLFVNSDIQIFNYYIPLFNTIGIPPVINKNWPGNGIKAQKDYLEWRTIEEQGQSVAHEMCHYILGLNDESENGYGDESAFITYRKNHPSEFPSSYGVLDYSEHTEISSKNDYMLYSLYPNPPDKQSVTEQFYIRRMAGWDWLEEYLEDYYPNISIAKPFPGLLINGKSFPNTDLMGPTDYTGYVPDPQYIPTQSEILSSELTIQTDHLFGSKVFLKDNRGLIDLGIINRNKPLSFFYLSDNAKLIVMKNEFGKSFCLEVPVSDLTNQKKELSFPNYPSPSLIDTVIPGMICDVVLKNINSQRMKLDLILQSDEPLEYIPDVEYFFGGNSDSISIVDLGSNKYFGEFEVDIDTIPFNMEGHLTVQVVDTAQNLSNFISTFKVDSLLSNQHNCLGSGAFNLSLDPQDIINNQTAITVASYTLPYKSWGQEIYPVTDMYKINFSINNGFSSGAGLNLNYYDEMVGALSENTIKLYKFDSFNSIWLPVENLNISLKDNYVFAIVYEPGIYCAFASNFNDDITPPSTIEDLVASPGNAFGEITLNWSAPGDDDITGKAEYYEIRWLDHQITDANWDSCQSLSYKNTPKYFEELEQATFRTNTIGSEFYFGIKAFDDGGNSSQLSNVAYSIPCSYTLSSFPLSISNRIQNSIIVLGENENASDSLDPELDILTQPPPSSFYAYTLTEDNYELLAEYRNQLDTLINYQLYVENIFPDTVTITWDETLLPNYGEQFIGSENMKEIDYIAIIKDTMLNILFSKRDVVSKVEEIEEINSYELYQNYPNPFNATTTIRFQLPSQSYTLLEVYNILGEKIVTLVNEELAKGSYNIRWNGKNNYGKSVASGIYIYRLITTNYVMSKKMVLLK